ncbi:hypothetical protein ACRYCC_36325 [Actinomadura scrupuli]|uniref:hypothetical protein n=1 Tax=Actinomadura scrupuli TaxID=559629 RepID=UPI003D9807EA
MIALFRFQVAGYLRSFRVLHPLIIIALLLIVVLAQGPSGSRAAELAIGELADVAAFLLPIGAWVTRGLLDTQPDVQRELSAVSVGGRHTPALAGLLAGYAVNLCLAALLLALPLVQALAVGLEAPALLTGIALNVLVAAAATVVGAWTSRAVITSAAMSVLVLLGASLAILLLSMGPLSPLSLPMIGWLRAAHHGPGAFAAAFPAVAVHIALWTAAVGLGYVLIRRHRP